MSPALIIALVVGAAVVGAAAGGVVGLRAARSARSAQTEQQRVSTEAIAALEARIDALAAALGSGRTSDYVITSLADDQARTQTRAPTPDPASVALTGREFTSVAVEESAVRIASLAHGVRRALAPRTRARIRFEMRQEVKRTRRQRRLDLKAARRHLRTQVEPADDRARDAA